MLGIYIHIPFCIQKCNYCDFYSIENINKYSEDYFKRLYEEIENFSGDDEIVDTIFIGGGTPSAVGEKYIIKLFDVLNKKFKIAKNAEITMELNPKTFDENKLTVYKSLNINRLSMGLQSANDDELLKLGRIHTYSEFENSYDLIRKVGFSNVNVDIIYGLMDSTLESLDRTISKVLALNCEHISAYALTISDKTPLYSMNFAYPNDDEICNQYNLICERLGGYRHYEISNFGKIPCKHNIKYWNLEPYIGFGASAYSYYENRRFSNTDNIVKYINQQTNFHENIELISNKESLFEYVMLGLRTDFGIDNEYMKNKYKFDFFAKNQTFIQKLIKDGLMYETHKVGKIGENEKFVLTQKGFFVSNSVISRFFIDK